MRLFPRNLTALTVLSLLCLASCEKPSFNEGPPGEPPSPSDLADATITDSPGKIIPPGFLGLSHEWGAAQDLAGTASSGKNLQYRQLLRNLLQYTAAPFVIRIGGNSTDTTVTLRASDLESLNDLSSDLDN